MTIAGTVPPSTSKPAGAAMIRPPDGMGLYMFAVLASLRAAQLMRGCLPRVESTSDKSTVVARLEVAGRQTSAVPAEGTAGAGGS